MDDIKASKRRRILLVGMKLSSECRERLTWIVARLTVPGDHVIAVHVLQSSSSSNSSSSSTALSAELDPGTRKELDETFQGVLGVYQGLCTLKQIKLDIKVVVGASVKECLVDAAKLEDATKLILGTSRFVPTGLSTSLAKYCLKRLPSSCSVTIIDRGKVIFERPGYRSCGSSSNSSSAGKQVSSCAQACAPSVLQRGIMKRLSCSSSNHQVSELDTSSTDNDSPGGSNDNNPASSSGRSSVVLEANLSESERSFPASPVSVLQDEFKESSESKEKQSSSQGSSNTCECDNALHGWPLRAFPLDRVASSPSRESEGRELSVVNWALQLPNRSQRRHQMLESPSDSRNSMSSCSNEFGCGHAEQKLLTLCKSATPPSRERSLLLDCLRQEASAPDDDVEEERATSTSAAGDENPKPSPTTLSSLPLSERLQIQCSKNSAAEKFDAAELLKATNYFSSKNLVGTGGCSKVYKGSLPSGQTVAIKCLNKVTPDAESELITEVEILSGLRHRNVISLLGYSADSQHRMLVYNFAANGNLEQCLHGKNSKASFLDWPSRRKIAIGAAEGLEYLHDGCPRPVIHRDVKSSNILLSSGNEALISDFGLAKWAPTTTPHITCTDVVGTFGYLAPEYFMFGKLNEKTDVYSFGVVLLELITGKHPISAPNQNGQENLIKWGRPLLESGNLGKLVDPRLNDDYDVQQMKLMVLAAALCLRQSPQLRPRMRKISMLLSGDEENSLVWANRELKLCKGEEQHCIDEDYARPSTSDCEVRTHLALAMLGVEDDVASECNHSSSSIDFVSSRKSLEDYFGGRCST